jgi:hypothetical protein
MAKAITPKEAANLLTRKRGRPAGVKNKPKALEKQIAHWNAEPRTTPVDFKELAQKLQNALAKSYVDYQELEKDLKYFTRLADVHEAQLDIKEKRINFMEMELAQIKAGEEGLFRDEE